MEKLLRRGSRGEFVTLLQEMLVQAGLTLEVDGQFGPITEAAVSTFQRNNDLKVDGVAGPITWSALAAMVHQSETPLPTPLSITLRESDFESFAEKYQLEPAQIKAVHEVESNGRGFSNGRLKILFEGHVFWKELRKRGINPTALRSGNENILYPSYFSPNPFYRENQYQRLNKAKAIHEEAALCASSWGLFQIMGYHYADMGFASAADMITYLEQGEAAHLEIFGRFLQKNNILDALRASRWADFARKYNGSSYKSNRYDTKLQTAYLKFKRLAP